jgi:hypothetical protein
LYSKRNSLGFRKDREFPHQTESDFNQITEDVKQPGKPGKRKIPGTIIKDPPNQHVSAPKKFFENWIFLRFAGNGFVEKLFRFCFNKTLVLSKLPVFFVLNSLGDERRRDADVIHKRACRQAVRLPAHSRMETGVG